MPAMGHMSADIAGMPPLSPVLPVESERKRADTAQGEDRRVAKARVAASVGHATERASRHGRLFIERDEATGGFVYRIIDQETGEILRQWPREEVLRMQKAINAARGLILDKHV